MFGHRGLYTVYPVEYKKGKPKEAEEDKLQLAAQAMCLEEMFSTKITGRGYFLRGDQKKGTSDDFAGIT